MMLRTLALALLALGIGQAKPASKPLTENEAREAVQTYLRRERSKGEISGGKIKSIDKIGPDNYRAEVVEYGASALGYEGVKIEHWINVKLHSNGQISLTSSLFGHLMTISR